MDKLVVIGKGLLRHPPTASQASGRPVERYNEQRTRARGCRRYGLTGFHASAAPTKSTTAGVGGLEYGYVYVCERANRMENELERPSSPLKPISVGVCAMENKVMAAPMQNILDRLQAREYIQIVLFPEKMIENDPIEEWPVCDCLIAFYSKGFPLRKAINYVKLRKPVVFNDLEMQYSLLDRRDVYKILNANGVDTPEYEVLNRNENTDGEGVINEMDDVLEINGKIFHKPFVEKPVSAENHNIYIYFPSDYGGGSQRLFRKVKNRSSHYSGESSVRSKGSFIYEEFLATDGTDVKVYSVGPDYAHAEARKSPALDGKVERDELGKEVRYPVILTAKEKLIARAVCLAFKQTVCGFDLLRANGKSYVCDVNGFSFVKNSQKYYDDCAQIMLEMITADLGPQYFPSIPPSINYLLEEFPDMPVPIPQVGNDLELRCVVGVIRHGDRTPKQKMKMIVKHKRFFDLFEELDGYQKGYLKIKKPKLLQKVLDIARDLLAENDGHTGCEIQEKIHKLEQLRSVLEMHGTFSGINRKLQFRLLNKKDDDGASLLLLILKWGGEHTQSGQNQAEELGRAFRIIYPGGEGEYASLPGSGFLRLHSTYRHDLKVYASDEGRVQMTAAAFTKGLLDLEGNPASVLVHLVKRDQAATNMLDTSTVAQNAMNRVKERLHDFMRSPNDFTEETYQELAPEGAEPIAEAMRQVVNPQVNCERLYCLIQSLMVQLREISDNRGNCELYHGETLQLMLNRWGKLEKDFKQNQGTFDISKIPDIYDCIKYDLLHNSHLNLTMGKELLRCVMPLADIVMPQEYGITKEEKLDIAHKICKPILSKIQADFYHTIVNEQGDVLHRLDHRLSKGVVSPKRHVRTRLYFTSESHVHSLTNILKHDLLIEPSDEKEGMLNMRKVPELNYMTQIIFLLFEDTSQPENSDLRYCVDIHFSPGVRCREELAHPPDHMDGSATPNPSVSLASSPGKQVHITISHENVTSLLEPHQTVLHKSCEDFEIPRPKELVHVVRRQIDLPYQQKLSPGMMWRRKFSAISQLSAHRESLGTIDSGQVKSLGETEITVGPSRRRSFECLHTSHARHYVGCSKSLETLLSGGSERLVSAPAALNLIPEMTPHIKSTVTPDEVPSGEPTTQWDLDEDMSLNTFKVVEEDMVEAKDMLPGLVVVKSPSQSSKLSSDEPLRSSSFGLVLATDVASTIYQLTPVASVPLSRMNDYFTSLTGVYLNYTIPPRKDPPLSRLRSHQTHSTIRDHSHDRDSKSPFKDSMEVVETSEMPATRVRREKRVVGRSGKTKSASSMDSVPNI